ncbi:MAG: OB-fold domain-containing protein [Pseudomonadota bacterium]
MNEIKLNQRGKVYSYTTVMLAPPQWYKGPVPFDLGYVELPEGVRIWTPLLGAEAGTFKIGQEVELDIDVMQEDEEGNEILGYCFVPVKKEGKELA